MNALHEICTNDASGTTDDMVCVPIKAMNLKLRWEVGILTHSHAVQYANYASRRSRRRDTVKLTVYVCPPVCSSCNCSTIAIREN